MAYVPLSQRVAAAIQKRQPADTPQATPAAMQHADAALRAQAASASPDPAFSWDTPERIRAAAFDRPPKKKTDGRQMSMAEAMRQLRKLKRTAR